MQQISQSFCMSDNLGVQSKFEVFQIHTVKLSLDNLKCYRTLISLPAPSPCQLFLVKDP